MDKTNSKRNRNAFCCYNIYSCIYIVIVVSFSSLIGNVYDVGKLNWYYPVTLTLGEYIKTFHLFKSLNKELQCFHKKELFKNLAVLIVSVVLFDVLEVSAGAPFVDNQDGTFSLAIMLTILTILPSVLMLGYDETIELLLNVGHYKGDILGNMMWVNICSTAIGAWLGAIVIPLDWDRPWQQWPIPCSLGCLFGNFIGNIANIVLLNVRQQYKVNVLRP